MRGKTVKSYGDAYNRFEVLRNSPERTCFDKELRCRGEKGAALWICLVKRSNGFAWLCGGIEQQTKDRQ